MIVAASYVIFLDTGNIIEDPIYGMRFGVSMKGFGIVYSRYPNSVLFM